MGTWLIGETVDGPAGKPIFSEPRQHAILAPKIAAGEHTFHAAFYHRMDDAPEPFFGSEWRFYENARSLIFFYHDPATTHIRLHSITDYIP